MVTEFRMLSCYILVDALGLRPGGLGLLGCLGGFEGSEPPGALRACLD